MKVVYSPNGVIRQQDNQIRVFGRRRMPSNLKYVHRCVAAEEPFVQIVGAENGKKASLIIYLKLRRTSLGPEWNCKQTLSMSEADCARGTECERSERGEEMNHSTRILQHLVYSTAKANILTERERGRARSRKYFHFISSVARFHFYLYFVAN